MRNSINRVVTHLAAATAAGGTGAIELMASVPTTTKAARRAWDSTQRSGYSPQVKVLTQPERFLSLVSDGTKDAWSTTVWGDRQLARMNVAFWMSYRALTLSRWACHSFAKDLNHKSGYWLNEAEYLWARAADGSIYDEMDYATKSADELGLFDDEVEAVKEEEEDWFGTPPDRNKEYIDSIKAAAAQRDAERDQDLGYTDVQDALGMEVAR